MRHIFTGDVPTISSEDVYSKCGSFHSEEGLIRWSNWYHRSRVGLGHHPPSDRSITLGSLSHLHSRACEHQHTLNRGNSTTLKDENVRMLSTTHTILISNSDEIGRLSGVEW